MNDFSVHRIIGRGGFGEVYGCRKADTGKMWVRTHREECMGVPTMSWPAWRGQFFDLTMSHVSLPCRLKLGYTLGTANCCKDFWILHLIIGRPLGTKESGSQYSYKFIQMFLVIDLSVKVHPQYLAWQSSRVSGVLHNMIIDLFTN